MEGRREICNGVCEQVTGKCLLSQVMEKMSSDRCCLARAQKINLQDQLAGSTSLPAGCRIMAQQNICGECGGERREGRLCFLCRCGIGCKVPLHPLHRIVQLYIWVTSRHGGESPYKYLGPYAVYRVSNTWVLKVRYIYSSTRHACTPHKIYTDRPWCAALDPTYRWTLVHM